MKLHLLNNKELEQSFRRAVASERKIMHVVLLHIQEVNRRKLYLRKCGSLFDYLIKEMKYSGSAASRRIEGAKLLTAVPAVAEKLASGEINLAQVCDIQRAVKNAEKIHQEKVSREAKAELVEKVLNQTSAQTQQLCAEILNIPVIEQQVVKTQKDKSKRIEVTFTDEQFKKYEQIRDLLAHKNFQKKHTQSIADVLETAFDELLKQQLPKSSASGDSANMTIRRTGTVATCGTEIEVDCGTKIRAACGTKADRLTRQELEAFDVDVDNFKPSLDPSRDLDDSPVRAARSSEDPNKLPPQIWHSLTPKRKKLILQKDRCCQFKVSDDGIVCGSTFNLQVDHIQPRWAGGKNDVDNLRVLCREHNLFRYRQ